MKNLWLLLLFVVLTSAFMAAAQAPGVAIYRRGRQTTELDNQISDATKQLFASSNAVRLAVVKAQLKRTSCELTLPPAQTTKLSAREVCDLGNRSHLRVGWAYLCTKCDQWHVNLAGGYLLTTNGVLATCYHVVQPVREVKDGCLVAADESGKVFPITEVLAANRYSDACLVRVAGSDFKPLPLNTNVYPGDAAYCFSDPLDQRGYFSTGVINRFYQFPGRRPVGAPDSAAYYAPTRLNVSTDWAPGSSGSAVLDECGNAIGHVSTIAAVGENEVSETEDTVTVTTGPTMIVFHEAVSARDVLLLIKPQK